MRLFVFLVVLALVLLAVANSPGAPVQGSRSFTERVGAARMSNNQRVPGIFEVTQKFRAGRRACVIARGDHKPVVAVGIEVYDAAGNLVASDQGRGDFAAAFWYPPREAEYKIRIKNPGVEYNDIYISIK